MNMEDIELESRLQKSFRLYGILFIILGIITLISTYKYIFPIGSILLILSGIFMIYFRKWRKKLGDKLMKNE